jgi:hypothetical protein
MFGFFYVFVDAFLPSQISSASACSSVFLAFDHTNKGTR